YVMYTQGDGAWIKNAAEEPRLVEAMRKGSDVVVKGVSARGTATTDTYSLKGLSQALDKIGEECQGGCGNPHARSGQREDVPGRRFQRIAAVMRATVLPI